MLPSYPHLCNSAFPLGIYMYIMYMYINTYIYRSSTSSTMSFSLLQDVRGPIAATSNVGC